MSFMFVVYGMWRIDLPCTTGLYWPIYRTICLVSTLFLQVHFISSIDFAIFICNSVELNNDGNHFHKEIKFFYLLPSKLGEVILANNLFSVKCSMSSFTSVRQLNYAVVVQSKTREVTGERVLQQNRNWQCAQCSPPLPPSKLLSINDKSNNSGIFLSARTLTRTAPTNCSVFSLFFAFLSYIIYQVSCTNGRCSPHDTPLMLLPSVGSK